MTLLADSTYVRLVELLFGVGASSAGEGRESKLEWTALWPTRALDGKGRFLNLINGIDTGGW